MIERNILVVDDEKAILELLSKLLTSAGYKVHCASSAEEGLEILKKEKLQVFILDMKLPGMNGMELCKKVRKFMPTAIIIAITGFTSLFDLVQCRSVGFDDYFAKPFDLEMLHKAVEYSFEKLDRWEKR